MLCGAVHCRMFSSTPDHYPAGASNTSLPANLPWSRQPKLSPDIARCPQNAKLRPVKNHHLRELRKQLTLFHLHTDINWTVLGKILNSIFFTRHISRYCFYVWYPDQLVSTGHLNNEPSYFNKASVSICVL